MTLKLTQIKSKNSATERQIANLASLGLRRINHTVEVQDTPAIRGMVEKVRHLLKIEEVNN